MKSKKNVYEAALLKKLRPLIKFDGLAKVFVLMRAPYMSPSGFPTELVPASEILEKIKADWHIVLRESKNG